MIVVGIHGQAESGKDACAREIVYAIESGGKAGTIIHFADILKDAVSLIFDIDRTLLDSTSGKEQCLSHMEDISVREILQKFGTEVCRSIYSGIWVWNIMERIKRLEGIMDVVCVADVRFLNEAKSIKSIGGYLIKVKKGDRPDTIGGSHICENDLTDYHDWDEVIRGSNINMIKSKAHRLGLQLLEKKLCMKKW